MKKSIDNNNELCYNIYNKKSYKRKDIKIMNINTPEFVKLVEIVKNKSQIIYESKKITSEKMDDIDRWIDYYISSIRFIYGERIKVVFNESGIAEIYDDIYDIPIYEYHPYEYPALSIQEAQEIVRNCFPNAIVYMMSDYKKHVEIYFKFNEIEYDMTYSKVINSILCIYPL